MGEIFAVSNQKGGVGKTTSSVSLSAQLALLGHRTLLIDLDPQGNATSGLGVEFKEEGADLYDVFFGRLALEEVLTETEINGLEVAPSSRDLIGVEIEVGKRGGREKILGDEIAKIRDRYDYIFIDCPPSSGLLTLNALGAAEFVIIPLQAEYYALEGLSALMDTIEFVRGTYNPDLEVLGVFMTMFDSRTNLSSQVEAEAREFFGDLMFKSVIPRNIKLSECPSHGLPICLYEPGSPGALSYKKLAKELAARAEKGQKGSGRVANG